MYSCTLSLTSTLHGRGLSTSGPGRFIVWEAGWTPGPVWRVEENSAPNRDSIPGPSSPQRVAIPTELPRSLLTQFLSNSFTEVVPLSVGTTSFFTPSILNYERLLVYLRPEYETNHSRTSSAVVPRLCSAGSKTSTTSSQGIRGHNYVIATFKLDVLLKIIAEIR